MVEQGKPGDIVARDAHFRLLCLIEEHPDYTQRRLAQAMGVSVGKTHYLLKALFDKGLVKAAKFGRSKQKLDYLYCLTPAGVRQRLQLTRAFLQRKEQEFESLRWEIARLRSALDGPARPDERID
ncbi:MAG TPA: MarR family EPS-associated transcriptional regulator [Burkholderiaceae bacterium]